MGWIATLFSPSRRRRSLLLAGAGLLVALVASLPLIYLLIRSAWAWPDIITLFRGPRMLPAFARTLLLILVVTLCAPLIGGILAWLTMRTDLPLRRPIAILAPLPLVIPSFIVAVTLIEMYGPRGVLQGMLQVLGVERLPSLYGLGGAGLVLVLTTYPYSFLTVSGVLRRTDYSMEEVARGMGLGRLRVFLRVTLPLLRPALASGALLAALYSLSDFGAVSLMRYETLTTSIFLHYESSANRALAAGLSLPLVLIAVAILWGEGLGRGRRRYFSASPQSGGRHPRLQLGAWRWLLLPLALLPIIGGLATPIGILVWWLLKSLAAGNRLVPLVQPLWNSIRIALPAALLATLAALPVAGLITRRRGPIATLVEKSIYIGFGLPGVVVALALIFFAINILPAIYQSVWLLIIACIILYIPAAVGSQRSVFLHISPRLEEAAAGLGSRPLRRFRRVVLPLAMPGILSGMMLVFLFSMKELPATLLLGPPGLQTLATQIWSSLSEAFFARTAAACLLLIAISFLLALPYLSSYGREAR